MAELIVALDSGSRDKALSLASCLKGRAGWLKAGLELFTAAGPSIIQDLKELGFKVFLDLKFYDIPNTVAGAVRSARLSGADMLTVHCQGGKRMCEAALAETAENPELMIFGVTALTSLADGELPGLKIPAAQHARELADLAALWGLSGVVCSGREASEIRRAHPALKLLCPGIRPAGSGAGDQRRTVTPADAVRAGADYLVVGRPVTMAADPARSAEEILEEMEKARK